jgi:hypothetical protein
VGSFKYFTWNLRAMTNFDQWCNQHRRAGATGIILFYPSKYILECIGTGTWSLEFYRVKEVTNDNEAAK